MLVDSKIERILAHLALSENTSVLWFGSCFVFWFCKEKIKDV